MPVRIANILAAATLATALAADPAFAQADWPKGPLKIVVIAAPGGFPDMAARAVAQRLGPALGQSVVVENKPGAGGNIATLAVAKAAPDGHTLLLTGNNHAVNPTLLPNPGFDYEKDLAPVSMVAQGNMMIVASPTLPANNVAELLAYARKADKPLAFASSAIGTPNHLGAELFAQRSGIEFTIVLYAGIGPAIPDLVTGRVHLAVSALTAAMPLVKDGKLKALAVTRPKRTPFAPDVPTAAESGLPGYDVNAWVCLMTTGGTPQPAIARLNAEVRRIMALPDVVEAFNKQGVEPSTSTPEELSAYIKAEAAKWGDVLKKAKK